MISWYKLHIHAIQNINLFLTAILILPVFPNIPYTSHFPPNLPRSPQAWFQWTRTRWNFWKPKLQALFRCRIAWQPFGNAMSAMSPAVFWILFVGKFVATIFVDFWTARPFLKGGNLFGGGQKLKWKYVPLWSWMSSCQSFSLQSFCTSFAGGSPQFLIELLLLCTYFT